MTLVLLNWLYFLCSCRNKFFQILKNIKNYQKNRFCPKIPKMAWFDSLSHLQQEKCNFIQVSVHFGHKFFIIFCIFSKILAIFATFFITKLTLYGPKVVRFSLNCAETCTDSICIQYTNDSV